MLNHNDVLPCFMGRPPEVNDKFDTVHTLQSFNNDRIVPGPLFPKLTNLEVLAAEEEKEKGFLKSGRSTLGISRLSIL